MNPTTGQESPSHERDSVAVGRLAWKEEEAAWPSAMVIAWFLAAIAVVLQTLTNNQYGYFRDELYFIATSKHLAFGYVDFGALGSTCSTSEPCILRRLSACDSASSGARLWSGSSVHGTDRT